MDEASPETLRKLAQERWEEARRITDAEERLGLLTEMGEFIRRAEELEKSAGR